jgi:membrane dipeptidase
MVTQTGKDHGLGNFGQAAIKETNRLGMMIDLSHTSHRTIDVLTVTRAPVIFSHSGCYEIGKNDRNVADDVLERLEENGGVIMIFFAKTFIRPEEPEKAALAM